MQADYALYLGYFAALFGQATQKEREIGWLLWDNRGQGERRKAILALFWRAGKYMRLLESGVLEEEARREVMRYSHTADDRIMLEEVFGYIRSNYFGKIDNNSNSFPTDKEIIDFIDSAMEEHNQKGGSFWHKLTYLNEFLEKFRQQLLKHGRLKSLAYIERLIKEFEEEVQGDSHG
jgi:hypothetical protein